MGDVIGRRSFLRALCFSPVAVPMAAAAFAKEASPPLMVMRTPPQPTSYTTQPTEITLSRFDMRKLIDSLNRAHADGYRLNVNG